MATHSTTLAWKIPWMEEPGRLQSMGSQSGTRLQRLHSHFSLQCIGEGNGNPRQCSCLENPRDGGLPSMRSHRVGHDWSDWAAAAAWLTKVYYHVKRNNRILGDNFCHSPLFGHLKTMCSFLHIHRIHSPTSQK